MCFVLFFLRHQSSGGDMMNCRTLLAGMGSPGLWLSPGAHPPPRQAPTPMSLFLWAGRGPSILRYRVLDLQDWRGAWGLTEPMGHIIGDSSTHHPDLACLGIDTSDKDLPTFQGNPFSIGTAPYMELESDTLLLWFTGPTSLKGLGSEILSLSHGGPSHI